MILIIVFKIKTNLNQMREKKYWYNEFNKVHILTLIYLLVCGLRESLQVDHDLGGSNAKSHTYKF